MTESQVRLIARATVDILETDDNETYRINEKVIQKRKRSGLLVVESSYGMDLPFHFGEGFAANPLSTFPICLI